MNKIAGIGLLAISLVTIILMGCSRDSSAIEEYKLKDKEEKVFPVEVCTVRQMDITEEIHTYGYIKEPDKIDIFSKVTGKIIQMPAEEGAVVYKDNLLAVIERDETGLKYRPVEVRASVSGRVEDIFLIVGARVFPTTPILNISGKTDLKLIAGIMESDLARIRVGQNALIKIDAYPNREYSGTVCMIRSGLNRQSGRAQIEIAFGKNDPGVMPGMFGRVRIITKIHKDILTLPEEAIRKNGEDFVFVAEEGVVMAIAVNIGICKGGMVEIENGPEAGTQVIIFAADDLKDGDKVKLIESEVINYDSN